MFTTEKSSCETGLMSHTYTATHTNTPVTKGLVSIYGKVKFLPVYDVVERGYPMTTTQKKTDDLTPTHTNTCTRTNMGTHT